MRIFIRSSICSFLLRAIHRTFGLSTTPQPPGGGGGGRSEGWSLPPSLIFAATASLFNSNQGQVPEHVQLLQEPRRGMCPHRRFILAKCCIFKKLRCKPGGMVHLTFSEPSLFRFQANEVLLMIMQKKKKRPFLNTPSRKSLDRALAACPGFTWCLCEPPSASAQANPVTPSVLSVESKRSSLKGLGSSFQN